MDAIRRQAGVMKLSAVELQANDGKHEDGEEQKQANLEQWDHGLHDGLQNYLQAWSRNRAKGVRIMNFKQNRPGLIYGSAQPNSYRSVTLYLCTL